MIQVQICIAAELQYYKEMWHSQESQAATGMPWRQSNSQYFASSFITVLVPCHGDLSRPAISLWPFVRA